MFKDSRAFSSFSVNDLQKAKVFYGETLGIEVTDKMGLSLNLAGGGEVFIYPKQNHEPATFTVLNFHVKDIEAAVTKMKELGIKFESYDGEIKTDGNNIFRGAEHGMGPNIAWFKDPAGNILSIVESGEENPG